MDRPDTDQSAPGQILLATYNGGNVVQAQLDSLVAQSEVNWHLRISDDGSTDDTKTILQRFADSHPGQVTLNNGPQTGFVANFLSLLTGSDIAAPWVAFCDQDDVWLPHKLERATAWLATQDPETPALYCGRNWVCDADLTKLHLSPLFDRPPRFANALVENIATGNTVVLNRAARDLAVKCAPHAEQVFAHDWWIYQLVTGAGGQVFFDPEPGVLYRQHDANQVGHGRQLRHVPQVLAGHFADRVGRNIAALDPVAHVLTPHNQQILRTFTAARSAPGPLRRMLALRRSGAYRQSARGQLGLTVAMGLGRV